MTNPLMESPFGSQGVFFMFGIFSAIGAIFEYFFVAETKGLSEKDKKSLYIPGAKYGRKLKHEEIGAKYRRLSYLERSISVASIADKNERKNTKKHSSSRMTKVSGRDGTTNSDSSAPKIEIT